MPSLSGCSCSTYLLNNLCPQIHILPKDLHCASSVFERFQSQSRLTVRRRRRDCSARSPHHSSSDGGWAGSTSHILTIEHLQNRRQVKVVDPIRPPVGQRCFLTLEVSAADENIYLVLRTRMVEVRCIKENFQVSRVHSSIGLAALSCHSHLVPWSCRDVNWILGRRAASWQKVSIIWEELAMARKQKYAVYIP